MQDTSLFCQSMSCESGKEERPSPRANCCVSESQKDQHTLDHVLAPHISMAHVKCKKYHATQCILLIPPELLKCNRTWPSNVIHALPHLRKKKNVIIDDGAKPCGSGTRGPVERLQQSVSISFDQSLKRHWCHGDISTTCRVFP